MHGEAARHGAAAQADLAAFLAGESKNCPGCNLPGANLKRRDLTGANLAGANLRGASFHRSNLRGANLLGADLTEANLNKTDLIQANFTGGIRTAVADFRISGLKTNLPFHAELLASAEFTSGSYDTSVIEGMRRRS